MDNTFRTKNGSCQVFEDKIVMYKAGIRGKGKNRFPASMIGPFLLFIVVAMIFLVQAYLRLYEGNLISGFVALGLALLILAASFFSLGKASSSEILKDRIRKISYHNGAPFLTRDHFVIEYIDENEMPGKHLLMLPGNLYGGKEEGEKAKKIFKDFGFL